MMNCVKHIHNTISNILLFSVFLGISGCTEKKQKEDYIARVNDSYFTREDLASLVDTSGLTSEEKDKLIKSWVYSEILYQSAVNDGITSEDEYVKIINDSKKKLAGSIYLNKIIDDEDFEISDDDLFSYYEKNKMYFKADETFFRLNRIYFNDENKAIKFRNAAIETNWQNALNIFDNDSSVIKKIESQVIKESHLFPVQIARIVKDFYPQEISIVITEKPGYYSLTQFLDKHPKGTDLPFESIRENVTKRLKAEMKIKAIEKHIKELYSKNDIEIKNEN